MHDINNLNEDEVEKLIATLKHPKKIVSFSSAYHKITSMITKVKVEEPVIDEDGIEYFLKVYQGRLEKNRFSIHIRFKEFHHHLVRIDVNPNINHNNPDGTKVIGSHIHIYSNSYESRDAVAISLLDSDFPNVNTLLDAFYEFLAYNNIE